MGVNTDTLGILEKETGDYFCRVLVHSKLDDFTWNLVIVYGDAQVTGKAKFLVELVHIIKESQVPTVIAGDFNLTRRSSDKNKPGGYNRWSVLFNSIIAQGDRKSVV